MPVEGASPGFTKLSRPRLARVHPRERLFRRLDECLEHSAAWVSGEAGTGKTTLISSYLEVRKLPALWYRVGCADMDATACCHHLQDIVNRAAPGRASAPPIVAAAKTSNKAPSWRQFFGTLYASIGASRVLVMDNSQEALSSAAFRSFLLAAISEASIGIRLIIASRTRPPSDFVRLRANAKLVVLESDELWFTEAESIAVQRLMATTSSVRSVDHMRSLHRLSGGWPAALKLMQEQQKRATPAAVSGRVSIDDAICDYLAAEVFNDHTAATRSFLLKVAHVPLMTVPVAEELGDRLDAAQILQTMHVGNVFSSVHSAAGERQYEFHPLFREFLLLRGRVDLSAKLRDRIARKAAVLLEQRGDLDAAAQVLIRGNYWDELQGLAIQQAPSLIARGLHQSLSAWLENIPDDRLASDPWLCYWYGVALLPFAAAAAAKWLQRAYERFREQQIDDGAFLAWSAIVDSICFEWADFRQLDHWLDEAESLRAVFGAPTDELATRIAASTFGALLYRRPQDPTMHCRAEQLLLHVEACSDPSQRILLGCHLHIHYLAGVGLNGELERLMKSIECPEETALTPFAKALLWALKSLYHRSRGRTAEAVAAAESASRVAHENGLRSGNGLLGTLRAHAWLNNGELARGREALGELEALLDPMRRIEVAHFHYLACLASLIADEGAQAMHQITIANAIVQRYGGPQQHALASLAQAQALHALHRTTEARSVLEHGRQIALSMRSDILCFQADLCEALFALDDGNIQGCAKALQAAFSVGAEHDYLNHNSFRPLLMARLCVFALAHGIFPQYARRLIRQRRLRPPHMEVTHWPWPVKIYTLGRFSLVVDGEVLAKAGSSPQKPVELLQVLIALGGRQIAIPILIETLWPDAESKGGRGAFESTLSRLRRLLGHDDSLLIEGGRITLNPALCWVDVWSFERLLGRLQETLRDPGRAEPTRLLEQTDKLLRLYQGEFLDLEECRLGRLSLQERLRARFVNALAKVGGHLEATVLWGPAAKLYRRAIEIEPLAEKAYRRLMLCLLRQGETAEALYVYFRCCEALSAGLGTTPSRETEVIRGELERASAPAGSDR